MNAREITVLKGEIESYRKAFVYYDGLIRGDMATIEDHAAHKECAIGLKALRDFALLIGLKDPEIYSIYTRKDKERLAEIHKSCMPCG
jgi:hypothetical protein